MTKTKVYLLSFLLAFCSLSYEFIMIKILSLTVGGRTLNYNLIVSIFTFSLGIGALYSEKVGKDQAIKKLASLEFLISWVGILGPLVLLIIHSRLLGVAFGLIIGFLTGYELPLLLKIKDEHDSEIIGFDYLGMFLASLVTPLVLFRWVGLVPALLAIGFSNLFMATVLRFPHRKISPMLFLLVALVGLLFSFHEKINFIFQEAFLWSVKSVT